MASYKGKSKQNQEVDFCDPIKGFGLKGGRKWKNWRVNKKQGHYDSDYIYVLKEKDGDFYSEEIGVNKEDYKLNENADLIDDWKDSI